MIALTVEVLARYFWRIAFVALVCAGAAAAALLQRADVFEARTLLLYKLGREYVYVPDDSNSGAKAPDQGDLQFVVNAEMQIVNNRELREETLVRLGPVRVYPALATAADPVVEGERMLNEAVSINAVPGTYMVQIKVRHEDPVLSAEIANTLIKVYLDRRAAIFRGQETQFLRDQLAAAQAQVAQISQSIRTLIADKALYSYENELKILTGQQAQLREQRSQAQAARAGLIARQGSVLAELSRTEARVTEYQDYARNPATTALESQILALEAERRTALRTLGEVHPIVVNLDAELGALSARKASEPAQVFSGTRSAANPIRSRLEGDLVAVRIALSEQDARLTDLTLQIDEGDRRLREFAQVTDEVDLMQQQLARQQAQVTSFDARVREAEIIDSLDRDGQTNVRIIEQAAPPLEPIGIPKSVRLLIALLFGAAVGLGAAILSHLMRPTFLSAEMVGRRLHLPVLAEVPYLPRAVRV